MNTNRVDAREYLKPFTPRMLPVDGGRLSYLDEGQGPVVVMLHGNPTWSYYYRNLALALKDRFRVIVPDHLGCGLSDKPRDYPYRLENHIANIRSLLDSLKIRDYSLVVHDWGGAIGMGVATAEPDRVKALVVLNTAAFRSTRRIPLRIQICRVPLLGDFLVRGLNGFARAAIRMAVAKPMAKATAMGFLAPYDSWENRVAILRFVQDIPLSPRHPSWQTLSLIEERLALLGEVPMLLCWGGRDFCFNRHFYDGWRQRFPEAEDHFFDDAGHYVLEDAGSEISSLAREFLVRHLLPGNIAETP